MFLDKQEEEEEGVCGVTEIIYSNSFLLKLAGGVVTSLGVCAPCDITEGRFQKRCVLATHLETLVTGGRHRWRESGRMWDL